MKLITESKAIRMKENLSKLLSLGDRFAGTDADEKAKVFMENSFRELDYAVESEEFECDLFEEKKSWIMVDGTKYFTRATFFSASTNGEQNVDIFYLDDSRKLFSLDETVKDKFVVTKRHWSEGKDHYYKEVAHLVKCGSIGCLMINYQPWPLVTTLETAYFDIEERLGDKKMRSIPSLVIGLAEGEKIVASILNGVNAAVVYSDVCEWRGTATNVIARKMGEIQKKIVIYAHRDTVGVPGANDNGSGQVVMLEVARIFKEIDLKYTLEFVSFSGEEHLGSQGSLAYLKRHEKFGLLDDIYASVELDMIGYGTIKAINGGFWKDGNIYLDEKLTKLLVHTSNELGYDFQEMFSDAGTPDSGRFASFGVPTTWVWCPEDLHEDTLEKVNFNNLKAIADVVSTMILKLNQN